MDGWIQGEGLNEKRSRSRMTTFSGWEEGNELTEEKQSNREEEISVL
jgi:hypothetical protein